MFRSLPSVGRQGAANDVQRHRERAPGLDSERSRAVRELSAVHTPHGTNPRRACAVATQDARDDAWLELFGRRRNGTAGLVTSDEGSTGAAPASSQVGAAYPRVLGRTGGTKSPICGS